MVCCHEWAEAHCVKKQFLGQKVWRDCTILCGKEIRQARNKCPETGRGVRIRTAVQRLRESVELGVLVEEAGGLLVGPAKRGQLCVLVVSCQEGERHRRPRAANVVVVAVV